MVVNEEEKNTAEMKFSPLLIRLLLIYLVLEACFAVSHPEMSIVPVVDKNAGRSSPKK